MMKKNSLPLPQVNVALLEYLETLFPDTCPNKGTSQEDIHIKIGQVSVVRKLKQLYESQQDNLIG